MRLFGKPGGTRAQAMGTYLTIPFDLVIPLLSTGTPERTFVAAARGQVFRADERGQTFAAAARGQTFTEGK